MARGSVSPFEIILTADERQELERRSRCYTAPYAQVVRAKIVLLGADGLANVEIAARLDTSPQVVHRWRKRFVERGLKGLEDAPRSGRPRVFSPLGPRRDQSLGMRAAGHHRRAAVALELRRTGSGADRPRRGGVHIGGHGLADLAI
ncbi:MAG TPA: helix-turn-helix domain-containing protein [Acidimicrobiales bacterium]|nr:helix-turn-helix domain-containing protein [Acidimicrobiales bacterium]